MEDAPRQKVERISSNILTAGWESLRRIFLIASESRIESSTKSTSQLLRSHELRAYSNNSQNNRVVNFAKSHEKEKMGPKHEN